MFGLGPKEEDVEKEKSNEEKKSEMERMEIEEKKNEQIRDLGQTVLHANRNEHSIYLLSIIGEIEGHECLPSNAKTTKYEHVLPKLAAIEDDCNVDGVLLILNTMGGDVESGLAIAEMVASMSKPTVSLVLGGSHSIGVPLAVSTDYSLIVPSGTMVIHPVRMSGTIPMFNFEVPTELPGVDSGILDPRDTYADASEWETKAKDLADRFIKNFAKYEGNDAGKALVSAGPQK